MPSGCTDRKANHTNQSVPGSYSSYRSIILLTQPYPSSSPPSFKEGTGVVFLLCPLCVKPFVNPLPFLPELPCPSWLRGYPFS